MTAPHALDGLIDAMLPTATELAVTVRDRDADAVHAVLGPVLDTGDRDQVAALIIALAVMIPDDVTFGDLVAWTHQDQLPYGEFALDGSEKYCRGCGQVKHRRCFSIDRSRKDGLFLRCKACVAEEHLERKARRERGRREAVA